MCRRETTPMVALRESARILGLHSSGAWSSCLATHIIRERLSMHGFVRYNFQRMQQAYHFMGWICPLVHMQICIAMKSAVSPTAARFPLRAVRLTSGICPNSCCLFLIMCTEEASRVRYLASVLLGENSPCAFVHLRGCAVAHT